MRGILIAYLLMLLLDVQGQVVEDFSDGDFTNNPAWIGDDSKFILDNEELRSNSNDVGDEFYLSTSSTLAQGDLEWRFRINMKLNTSGANYTDVFLMADNSDLSAVTNGYFVRIGNTRDEVSLYKIVGGTETQLTNGTDSRTHNKNITVRVTKAAFGTWTVSADYTGGVAYEHEGDTVDNDITASSYFGFFIRQSSASFHLKHFMDDIYVGPMIVDTQKPTITATSTPNDSTILLTIDEAAEILGAGFNLDNGIGSPANVAVSGNEVELTFNQKFVNMDYELSITNLADLSGNRLDTLVKFSFFQASAPLPGNLVFSEIFADPTPVLGLPDAEFIELYNLSSEPLELQNCSFSDGGTPASFPAVVIPSSEYLIVVKSGNEALFSGFGNVIGLASFPALNNGGDNLELRNAEGDLLDAVAYTTDFYHDDIKEDGGYSLELIEFSSQCKTIDNWRASSDASGGTPGSENSRFGVRDDIDAPVLLSAIISSDTEILISLSENMVDNVASLLSNYELLNPVMNPISVQVNEVSQTLLLEFSIAFEANREYVLNIKSLEDCIGNQVSDVPITIVTTEAAELGDVLINELLFNPKDDGVDFVELYNSSDKFIELASLLLARFDNEERKDFKIAGSAGRVLYPGQFLALSTDTSKLKEQYTTGSLEQISSLPAMSNTEGTVLLFNSDTLRLDSISYTEDQHFPLISDVNGVSLERINYRIDYVPSNWHSASSVSGFATPGNENSQFRGFSQTSSEFSLLSKTFSPDADGYEDVLIIKYELGGDGTVVNGYVFNLSGKQMDHAINNESLSTSGILSWDGIMSNGTKLPVGNYIFLLQSIDLEGRSTKKKLAFTVLGLF